MSLEDKPLPEGVTVDEELAEAIRSRLVKGKLTCAHAFQVARELELEPLTVGHACDALRISLTRCQLGIFGYPGKTGWDEANAASMPVPDGLMEALKDAMEEGNPDEKWHAKLPCATAWEIASEYDVPRIQVGYLATELGIQITPCQLGAF